MKKIFPFLFLTVVFASCEQDPNLNNVQYEIVTYTQYDKSADFADYSTFFIADTITLIGRNASSYMDADDAAQVINAVTTHMVSRGYTQVTDKTTADLGIQLSYIQTKYVVDVLTTPYWWSGYPGYWSPSYWGPYYGGWYYPYVNHFSYYNASLLCDMLDLTTDDDSTTTSRKIPVLWQSHSIGLLSYSTTTNTDNMISGIDQAFKQSAYIKR